MLLKPLKCLILSSVRSSDESEYPVCQDQILTKACTDNYYTDVLVRVLYELVVFFTLFIKLYAVFLRKVQVSVNIFRKST